MYNMDAILLDGDQRSTLAATRALGKKGIKVIVGAVNKNSISSSSKYCSESFVYTSPYKDEKRFIDQIYSYVSNLENAIIVPMTDMTTNIVLQNMRTELKKVKIPFVDYEQFVAASDKCNLFKIAQMMNIPMPKTIFSDNYLNETSMLTDVRGINFPVVIKPARSVVRKDAGWIKTKVRYARNRHEVINTINEMNLIGNNYLIQEKIEGNGIGIFCLVKNGDILCHFAHKRIREKPPSGGVSVLCESIDAPQNALESARKLLASLNWNGVAMVEFKWDDRDNIPKLMEINGRFWGSLQLAISAGVNFPHLLYSMAAEEKIELPKEYIVGIKSRWELGDLDHLLIRMTNSNKRLHLSLNTISRVELLKEYICDYFRPSIKNEIFRLDDPWPFMFEFKDYIINILKINRSRC